ncbi:MAG: NAD+ synthase [Treponema sp.]|nr:NAD+ synthase [Treponema sp.]
MRVSIAQINSTIGDFRGNMDRIMRFTKRAVEEHGSDLLLFPELAVCGYPPMDLLDQDRFVELNTLSVHILQRELPRDIAVGVGFVGRNPYAGGKALVNEYGIILNGKLVFEQLKTLLPTYDVFDEARNFERAQSWSAFEYKDERIGIAICEDVWRETATPGTYYVDDPVRALLNQGISMLCVPSASPYYAGKLRTRKALAERISRRGDLPIVYVNAVGANDSIIFDGRSFIAAPAGKRKGGCPGDPEPAIALMARGFEEDLVSWDTVAGTAMNAGADAYAGIPGDAAPGTAAQDEADPFGVGLSRAELDILENALVLGIREYMEKCGFSRAHLGLSGGIDSALVAYLGVRAAGKDRIAAFSMPSRFSSRGSKDDAEELARNLGCSYSVLPIEPVFTSFLDTLKNTFGGRPFDLAEENLQARIRGALLMAYSNKFGSMLLTTGNKSELAMGYCTLYGDMCGALGPIGDLFKTEVFALCRRINEKSRAAGNGSVIPDAILAKPPSAELRPDQKDQDSLPPYEELDQILKLYLFENLSKQEIAARGWDGGLVGGIIQTVARAEFKRRQAPPVLKVSPRAFGMGRRMPIARVVHEI